MNPDQNWLLLSGGLFLGILVYSLLSAILFLRQKRFILGGFGLLLCVGLVAMLLIPAMSNGSISVTLPNN